ncbi:DUF2971 domain-containing protein [Gracilimonas sp.]|uniref:DUF2971 domain-containing protein n=1 Tax=Gracilimonas sp. TaxID=1974203 RepID=UPI0032EFF0B5
MIEEEGLLSHYTKIENLEKILKNARILLGQVKNMDDPRESSLGWIDTVGIGQEIDLQAWERARKLKQVVGEKLRVFCTTKPQKDNHKSVIENSIYGKPRMWAQYGQNFKGFCILFKKEKLKEAIESKISDDDYLIQDSVYYPSWLHLVQGGTTIEYGENISLSEKKVTELITSNEILHSIYFKKGYDWREENEYRWLIYSKKVKPIYIDVEKAIHSIVLGYKFPESRYDEAKNYCLKLGCKCYALNYTHPKYELIELI